MSRWQPLYPESHKREEQGVRVEPGLAIVKIQKLLKDQEGIPLQIPQVPCTEGCGHQRQVV